jgi:protein-disulfide isomerase
MDERNQSKRLRNCFVAFALSCLLGQLWNLPALAQTAGAANPLPTDKDTALQQAIHDYILAHPETLIESLQRAKIKQEQNLAAVIKSRIVAFRKDLVDDPNAPVLGNPAGDVTLVEFFDYRCPYCRQVEPWLQTLIKEDPGVRIVQKEFPILGPASVYAAHVAIAALKQGKHTEFHNALMAKKGNIDEAIILQVAEAAGLDINRIKVDMNSPDVDAEIERSTDIAKALHLSGTPAFIIGTELVPGATDLATFKSMVEDARHGFN